MALSHAPASPLYPLPAGLVLHIDEDGVDQNHVPPHSPISSLSGVSDTDLDSTHTNNLLAVTQSHVRCSPSPSNTVTTPSLTSVNTVLDHKSPSPSMERLSPSHTVPKPSGPPETVNNVPTCHLDLKTPSPIPVSVSPPSSSSSSLPPVPAFNSPSRPLPDSEPSNLPMTEPSLDEALDKLLAMSFAQNHASSPHQKMEVPCEEEVQEEFILPVDRGSIRPDTFASTTITDESVDGNGDLDWADEELSMSFHDGIDGTMTPYTERPFTDGSMTPLTEASWMDESMTPSSCPGTPEAALDLPLLQTPTMERVSASGHVCLPSWLARLLAFWF